MWLPLRLEVRTVLLAHPAQRLELLRGKPAAVCEAAQGGLWPAAAGVFWGQGGVRRRDALLQVHKRLREPPAARSAEMGEQGGSPVITAVNATANTLISVSNLYARVNTPCHDTKKAEGSR